MLSVRMLVIVIFTSLMLGDCDTEPAISKSRTSESFNELPVADFAWKTQGDCNSPVLEILFENGSKNSDSYDWEFGDGTTSHETNPKKIYAKSDTYKVSLTATRNGESDQLQKEIFIERNSDGTGPKIRLSYESANPTSLEIEYTISAGGLPYSLSFGDGQALLSKEEKIRHTYSGRGLYLAIVTVENEEGTYCASVSVAPYTSLVVITFEF